MLLSLSSNYFWIWNIHHHLYYQILVARVFSCLHCCKTPLTGIPVSTLTLDRLCSEISPFCSEQNSKPLQGFTRSISVLESSPLNSTLKYLPVILDSSLCSILLNTLRLRAVLLSSPLSWNAVTSHIAGKFFLFRREIVHIIWSMAFRQYILCVCKVEHKFHRCLYFLES